MSTALCRKFEYNAINVTYMPLEIDFNANYTLLTPKGYHSMIRGWAKWIEPFFILTATVFTPA